MASDANAIPSDSQNAYSGGFRSFRFAAVACPERYRANGCTCAHLQHSCGLISSLPSPGIDLHSPTGLTVKVVTFNANRTHFWSLTGTFFGMGITVATLHSVGYTHWCTSWIFIPNVSARLPIFLHLNRILLVLSTHSSPSYTSPPSTPRNFVLCTTAVPCIHILTGCSMATSSLLIALHLR